MVGDADGSWASSRPPGSAPLEVIRDEEPAEGDCLKPLALASSQGGVEVA